MSDLIDRQDAIDVLEILSWKMSDEGQTVMSQAIAVLKDLKPAKRDKKHGEWLWKLADNGWADHICSECGWTENTDIHVSLGYRYCPNCGAYMGIDR